MQLSRVCNWIICFSCLIWPAVACGDDQPDLGPLVQLLGQIDDPQFHLDLLKGMRDGLRGRKSLPMPDGWKAVYPKLAASENEEVRQLAKVLALVFDDPSVLAQLRATVSDRGATVEARQAALDALLEKRVEGLTPLLFQLLNTEALRGTAIRGLANYPDDATPAELLERYETLDKNCREDAVATLAGRPTWALALLDAVESKLVARTDISVFRARQLQNLGDKRVTKRLAEVWGEIRATSEDKKSLIGKYKKLLTPKFLAKADLSNGRVVFSKTCMKCHRLYGEGGQVGPDITGSNRNNLDYVLENILDPSAAIGKDYQLMNILTIDGRLIDGIIVEQSNQSVTIQTENERLLLSKDDIDEMNAATVSMMPDGQFERMSDTDIRDLVAYLATRSQVPLPDNVAETRQ